MADHDPPAQERSPPATVLDAAGVRIRADAGAALFATEAAPTVAQSQGCGRPPATTL
ncbi:MAG: hypothetical protein IPO66_14060 [Rhodanobacteraceae bacterium]|nr:hypothetical protein [Rhodanobacteraceae bacterium]